MLTRDFYPSLNGMVVFTFWEQGWPYMCTGWMDNEQLRGYGESRSEEGVCVCVLLCWAKRKVRKQEGMGVHSPPPIQQLTGSEI